MCSQRKSCPLCPLYRRQLTLSRRRRFDWDVLSPQVEFSAVAQATKLCLKQAGLLSQFPASRATANQSPFVGKFSNHLAVADG
jgi:hypothetical protein